MTSFIETLNQRGDQLLNLAWPMLWQSSLLIVIVFALDFALRRKIRAAIRYALWLAVLVKLLLPPSLALPTSAAWWLRASPQPAVKAPAISYSVSYGEQTAPDFPLPPAPVIPSKQPALSFAGWTIVSSGVASVGLLAWLLIRWRQIHQKVRRAKDSEELLPLLNTARRLAHLRPDIQLKLTDDSMSPAVCGLFRPVILLPQSLVEKLSDDQLRAVLLHEAIHLRRGDVWVNCAQALLQIVFWWHPLLWLANARIRRVREEAVDDAVMLALRDDADIYAPTLLEVAKFAFRRPLASLGLVGILESRSALRQRIERLMNFNAPRKAGLTVVSVLGILVFSAVALPMGEAPQKTTPPSLNDATTQSPTNPDHFSLDAVDVKLTTNTPQGEAHWDAGYSVTLAYPIYVTADGHYRREREATNDLDVAGVRNWLESIKKGSPDTAVQIHADAAAPLKAIKLLVDLCQELGIHRVALKTESAGNPQFLATSNEQTAFYIASPTSGWEAATNANPGILQDTNFRATLHALEQRTKVETLAEPEAVTTAGRQVSLRDANHLEQVNFVPAAPKNIQSAKTNGIESAQLVQDGKLLYEMGKFEEAEAKLKAALALNPTNPAAFYYLNLVKQVIYSQEEHNGTNSVADSEVRVPNAWLPKVGFGLPVPNPYATNTNVHTSPKREAIYKKLNDIRFASVSWPDGIPLSEAIRFLAEQSRLRDPDQTGINFIFNPNAEGSTNAATLDPSTINIKLILTQDVSLHDVLDAIVKGADKPTKYAIEDYGVVFSPYDPTKPQLEMRVFKVDQHTFTASVLGLPKNSTPTNTLNPKIISQKLGVDLTAPGRSIAYNDRLGLLFLKATSSELDTIERVVQALNQTPPQIHIKARFIEVSEGEVEGIFKAGKTVDTGRTNTVEIITADKMKTLLHELESTGGAETLGEPEAETTSGRQVQMRTDNSTVDLVPWLLSDGYTFDLQATVSKSETMIALANTWDGQTLALVSSKSDGTNYLVVFITATVIDSVGNPVHSVDELPFNPSTIPQQPQLPSPSR